MSPWILTVAQVCTMSSEGVELLSTPETVKPVSVRVPRTEGLSLSLMIPKVAIKLRDLKNDKENHVRPPTDLKT